jgi:peptide/nickel transport system permease protein
VRHLLLRRLAFLPLVLFGMSVITFFLTHVVPGDPARLLAGAHASKASIAALRHQYGLDRPLPTQYVTYVGDLLHGDLGMSITTRRPVLDDLREFFPATAELTIAAMVIVVVVGLGLGLLAGLRHGRAGDHAIRLLSIAGVSVPVFWLGIVLQIVFYQKLAILPVGGRLGDFYVAPDRISGSYLLDSLLHGDTAAFGSAFLHLILPAVTLAAGSLAVVTRMMRASVIDVAASDHVRAAHAKGLAPALVTHRHVFRNALIPSTTVIGLQFGTLLAGSILVEVVFSWPGIGLYAVNAISNLDYTAIMGVTLLVSLIYVLVNLAVDVAYLLLDPRIVAEGELA